VSSALNIGDQIASVASAVIGLAALLITLRRTRVRERSGGPVGAAAEPAVLGMPRRLLAVPFGACWLLAAALALYGHVADSYPVYFTGLVLIGGIISASAIAAAPAGHPGPGRGVRLGSAALALAVAGLLLALAAYEANIPTGPVIPAAATAFGAVGLVLVRANPPASRLLLLGTGAVTLGAAAGVIALYLQHGPVREWESGRRMLNGHASGTARELSGGAVEVTGAVRDDAADDKGVRLYLVARPDGAPEYSVPYTATGGVGTTTRIDQDRDPSTPGHVFPARTRTIDARLCRTTGEQHRDFGCLRPFRIWPH